MKILLVNNVLLHHKNYISIRSYKNIEIFETNSIDHLEDKDLSIYECVMCHSMMVDVSKYPNTFFIFGPHISVFPPDNISLIFSNHSIFNCLSNWVRDGWLKYGEIHNNTDVKQLPMFPIPFGINTVRFNETTPIYKRTNVFVYHKGRSDNDLQLICKRLSQLDIPFKIFSYKIRYNEQDYLEYLKTCKYGIWVGAHESQGFALQEALSCNVPLLVWTTTSMNQEYGMNYDDLPATTIPYWSNECGEFFTNIEQFDKTFEIFLKKVNYYSPRNFILTNLSIDVCENRLMDIIKLHKSFTVKNEYLNIYYQQYNKYNEI